MKTTKWYALLTLVALAALLVSGIGASRAAAIPRPNSGATSAAQPAINLPVFGTDLQMDGDNASRPHNSPDLENDSLDPAVFGSTAYDDATDNSSYAGHYATSNGGLSWLGGNILPFPGGVTPQSYISGYYHAAGAWIVTTTAYNQTNNCGGGSGIYSEVSTDNGQTFAPPVLAAPNTTLPFVLNYDNHTAGDVNPQSRYGGRSYIAYTAQASSSFCGGADGGTIIALIHSNNGGQTWSSPVRVSDPAFTDVSYPRVAIDEHGIVHVSFDAHVNGGTMLRQAGSIDGGDSFYPSVAIFDLGLVGYPDPYGNRLIRGNNSAPLVLPTWNGDLNNYQTTYDSPATANNVYAIWTDHLNDGSYVMTDTQNMTHTVPAADIAFSHSNDGGATWSAPIRVNDDPQGGIIHDQFMPAMTVGNDGVIHIAWYDRRDDPNNINYNVYYAQSTDNGLSFSANQRVSDVPSNPRNYLIGGYGYLGTRMGIAVNYDNSEVMVAWTDERTSGQQHIYISQGTLPNPHTPTPAPPTNTPGGPTNTPAPTNTTVPPTPQPTVCPNPFVDIINNIFFHAINYLYCHGAVNGTDPTHYSPAGTSTRSQFAKVVVLGFGTPFYTPATQDFTDVPPGYFAYAFIESGFHAGILSGFDANSCAAAGATYPCYLPNRPITRGQITKLVVNAAHYPLYTPTSGQTFTDVPPSNVFYASIETAHNKGVINGYPDHSFHPNDNVRRDAMAQIVYAGVTTP